MGFVRRSIARVLSGGGVVTALDFPVGFGQVLVTAKDVAKSATRTPIGTIFCRLMQMGDINSGTTFQKAMEITFGDLAIQGVFVYLDNIWVATCAGQHLCVLRRVFERLRLYEWAISMSKAEWASRSTNVLGFTVDADGIHVDHRKAFDVLEHPEPRNANEVQQSIGMVQYLSPNLPELSLLLAPLQELSHGSFEMTPTRRASFVAVRDMVSRAVSLAPIDWTSNVPVWVVADASQNGVGGVVGQGPEHLSMRPAAFWSKRFTAAQSNWPVHDQELLAIVSLLDAQRDQLMGVPLHIVTDNKALATLFSKPLLLEGRAWRWIDFLHQFHIVGIKHVAREENWLADYLSQLPVLYPGQFGEVSDPCPDAELPILTVASAAAALETSVVGGVWAWREAYALDPGFGQVVDQPERFANLYRWDEESGVLLVRRDDGEPDALVVPLSAREALFRRVHSEIGHMSTRYTVDKLRRCGYWWPEMVKSVNDWCAACATCATSKHSTQSSAGLLRSLTVPTKAWRHIAMDFFGPLERQPKGEDSVLCVKDRFSGQVRLFGVSKSITGKGVQALYERQIYPLHGWPASLVSDRDPRFTGSWWQTIMAQAKVELRMSSAAHPQTDGQAERAVGLASRVLLSSIIEASAGAGVTWLEALPHVEFAMNSAMSRATGLTAFDVVYGATPSAFPGPPAITRHSNEDALETADRIRFLSEWARDRIVQQRTSSTITANRSRREVIFAVGDYVWLSTRHFRAAKGALARLMPKFVGPFRVLMARDPAYKLELPSAMSRRYPVFHVSLLKAADPLASLVTVDDVDTISMDASPLAVIDSEHEDLLVRWTDDSTSWEPAAQFAARFPHTVDQRLPSADPSVDADIVAGSGRARRVRRPPGFLDDFVW